MEIPLCPMGTARAEDPTVNKGTQDKVATDTRATPACPISCWPEAVPMGSAVFCHKDDKALISIRM